MSYPRGGLQVGRGSGTVPVDCPVAFFFFFCDGLAISKASVGQTRMPWSSEDLNFRPLLLRSQWMVHSNSNPVLSSKLHV